MTGRVLAAGAAIAALAAVPATAPAAPRPFATAVASWYGDEGDAIACGPGRIPADSIHVASKTLPCGARLTVCDAAGERCFWVRVVDRGPYVDGRDLDLSRAAMRRLDAKATGVIVVQVRVDGVPCRLPRWAGRPYRPLCRRAAA